MRRVEQRVRREEWQDLQDLGRHESAAYKGRAKNGGLAMFKIADFDASTSSSRSITFFPGTNLSLTGPRRVTILYVNLCITTMGEVFTLATHFSTHISLN